MNQSHRLLAWLPVLAWLCVIASESTGSMGSSHTLLLIWRALLALHVRVSYVQLQWINFILRKCGHLVGYGILGVLFVRAWLLTARSTPNEARHPLIARALALGLFCTLLVSTADEVHQAYLPGRTGAAHDVALDMLGAALLGGLFAKTLQRRASGQ